MQCVENEKDHQEQGEEKTQLVTLQKEPTIHIKDLCFFIDYYLIAQLKKLVGEPAPNLIVMQETTKALKDFSKPQRCFPSYGVYQATEKLDYLQDWLSLSGGSPLQKTRLEFTRQTLDNRTYVLTCRFSPHDSLGESFHISKYIVKMVIRYKGPTPIED